MPVEAGEVVALVAAGVQGLTSGCSGGTAGALMRPENATHRTSSEVSLKSAHGPTLGEFAVQPTSFSIIALVENGASVIQEDKVVVATMTPCARDEAVGVAWLVVRSGKMQSAISPRADAEARLHAGGLSPCPSKMQRPSGGGAAVLQRGASSVEFDA